ncbi:RUN and FYVE domain-containing protein 2-like [Oppia nitens]|uniref:RUN and FYVE domain-containing protein 2-like n=1 Tax=Oppia nitens TaxID=1686743 RepID=UPI0023D9FE99|nr:RUN and FYVE domain-containing protein 2-like [Oppia nitens]
MGDNSVDNDNNLRTTTTTTTTKADCRTTAVVVATNGHTNEEFVAVAVADNNDKIVVNGNGVSNNSIAVGRKISIKSNKSQTSDKSMVSSTTTTTASSSDGHSSIGQTATKRDRNRWSIERSNYVNLMKLIVKELIESSAKTRRIVDSTNISLNNLFILLEIIFRHGLKSKKGIFETKKDIWAIIEIVEKLSPDASDITTSARQVPTVRTSLGKARAWMRLALMKKRLSDYFRLLLENREILLNDYYEDMSIMMSDEAVVIGGLLVGLNILDCNFCVKEDDLDSNDAVIDLSLYLKDNIQFDTSDYDWREQNHENDKCNGVGDNISIVLDQKNYVEELNKHLSATVVNLEHKLETLQTDNTLMKEELETLRNIDKCYDIVKSSEVETINKYKEEVSQLEEQLKQEVQKRETVEKELESQVFLKTEAETAMQLLERDVLEKQDTVITLRRQLEDVKAINLQMYNKLQECETSIKNKCNHITHLEQNISSMATNVSKLEAKISSYEKQRQNAEESNQKLNEKLTDVESQRISSERDAIIEKEWRTTLQTLIDEQQEQITSLQHQMENMRRTSSEANHTKSENHVLKKRIADYELSLEEMGRQLQDSKLEVDGLKESTGKLKEAVWTDDKNSADCHQCSKPFSIARRRHHCRSCGEIFCGNCSNNEMPLPSNKKPVRVCDSCHAFLLERYSAT